MRYLVAGATGFVGSHVAEGLLRMGEPVRVLAPDRQKALFLAAQGADIVRGDPADARAAAAALSGVQAVIWSAETAPDPAALAGILAACGEHRLERVVVISSAEAYGFHLPHMPVDERHPLRPEYPEQWAWAELEAVAQRHAGELPITILRPVHAFGPRDGGFTRQMVESIVDRSTLALVGGGRAGISLIYGADIGRAAAQAARHPAALGRTYLVRGFDTTWQEFLGALSGALGRKTWFRPVSYGMARLTAGWGGRQGRDWVDRIGLPRLFDDGRFRREVGWGPAWELGPAAAATAADWLATSGTGAPGA